MQAKIINKATDLAKDIMEKAIKEGDTVIDATVGNGHDTIFLCKLVGEYGKVYGFDIQKEAIEKTKSKLIEHGINNMVDLIQDGHENMRKYIDEQISGIMFNLGYLPGKNHQITTKYDTTIKAIDEGFKLLKPNGIITIVVYPGHEEGYKEKQELLNYFTKVDQKKMNVLKMEFINQINKPPFLMVIEKK